MGIVTINARLFHNPSLRIANNRLTADIGEFMNSVLALAVAQTHQRVALEVVVGSAIVTPRKWIIAVLTDLDSGLAVMAQFLAHVVQKRGGNAERNGTWRGRYHLVNRIIRLFDALHNKTVLVVCLL